MSKIDSYLAFVKEQVAVQERLANKYDEDYRRTLHMKTADRLAELAHFLEEIRKKGTVNTGYLNRGDAPQKRLFLTFEEIENAPEELLKELNIGDTDRNELLIEYIIAELGGVLSLDRIMIELYKRTREIPKRGTTTSRLYRMASRGMIYNVPGRKGVYSTYELTEPEAKKMFGQFDESADEAVANAASSPTPTTATKPVANSGEDTKLRAKLMGSAAASIR
jgi:hypothetical protein